MNQLRRNIWDEERCKREALKYTTRKQFCKCCQMGYKKAREFGILDAVCAHMKHGAIIWEKESCQTVALQFNLRVDFQKQKRGAYAAACKNGWLDEICSHMHEYTKVITWTKNKCAAEAKKYTTRSAFNKNSRGAFSSAYNNGWLDEICSHMEQPHKDWNIESLKDEALKYSTRSEFSHKCQKGYVAARKLKVLDAVCVHMDIVQKKWTHKEVKEISKQYQKRSHFQKEEPGAYAYAKTNNFLNEVVAHMDTPLRRWDLSSLQEEALKYKTLSDFVKGSHGAYQAALKKKCIKIITSHMSRTTKWTSEKCLAEAKKYKTRTEFSEKNGSAYQFALKHNILDEICSHMVVLGNLFTRMIYAYEFPDNYVYVGLTYNENKRKYEHLYEKLGPVKKHMIKTSLTPVYKKLHDYESVENAKALEQHYINKYKKEGWTLLNSSKAGALGGNKVIWTKEECHKVALRFKRKRDFANHPDYGGAVNAARKHKWMDDICTHMTGGNIKWNFERCLEEAQKYSRKNDFMRNGKGGYNFAKQKGFLEEICKHMKS